MKKMLKSTLIGAAAIALISSALYAEEPKKESEIPDWLKNISLSGDVRLRYQIDTAQKKDENGDFKKEYDRTRPRLRARFKADAKINEMTKAVVGITTSTLDSKGTGTGDPRSGNQTFETSSSKKIIYIDLAYINFEPMKGINLTAGKMENKIWKANDLLWAGDITPEGGAVFADYKITDDISVIFNGGGFMLQEVKEKGDAALYFAQAGAKAGFGDMFAAAGFSYYNAANLQNSGTLAWSKGTNSAIKNDAGEAIGYVYDYNNIAVDIEAGYKFGNYQAALNGQYVTNMADDVEEKDGFLIGVKGGSQKVKNLGDFTIQYDYRQLKKDAWLDILPDTDIMDGATGVKGHRIKAVAGLMENMTFGLTLGLGQNYIKNKDDDYETTKKNRVIKADLSVKF